MSKAVLITGDDFGESSRVNEAVERDFDAGFLRQTSLMVVGSAVEEAVRIARRHTGLCVGLHLAVTECAPLSKAKRLVNSAGRMRSSPVVAGLRYALDPRLGRELECEVQAQFAEFVRIGFAPVYFDGHMHLHLHPAVWRIAVKEAGRAGFRAFRRVRERTNGVYEMIFRALSARASGSGKRRGLRGTDWSMGLRDTFGVTPEVIRSRLRGSATRPGIGEFVYHPGKEPAGWDPAAAADVVGAAGFSPASWDDVIETRPRIAR